MAEIKLYPHNQETYEKIIEMWQTTNRVAAIQATGTGKSFLILKCLFDFENENKVVLAPTEYIFGQLIEHSDEVISNVEFITYSKMANMTNEEIHSLNPSLIVLDEFHRCGAEQWGKGVQNLLNLFPNTKVLGTSATPIRYLDNERDMSDELFDGNIAVNLSLAEAIVKGILPMPKYVSALYTFEDEANNLRDKVIKSHNSDEEKEELLKQIDVMKNKLDKSKGIPNILKKHLGQSNSKFIVFCKNKEHLNEMKIVVTDWFKKAKVNNNVETYTVYTGYENLESEFESFRDNKNRDTLKLLFSIEMLNEGVHVENIDGVMLLRTTISPIIYYQQIGRGIDAGSAKQPIIFDFVNNFDNIKTNCLVQDLEEARKKENYAKKEYEGKENLDIPEFIVYDEVLEAKDLFDNIEDSLIDNWDIMFNQLTDFYYKYGNCNATPSVGYKKLSVWILKQRGFYKKNQLSNERIERLQSLNFNWGDKADLKWDIYYQLLLDYFNKNGNSDVLFNYKVNNRNLGGWVNRQRMNFKRRSLTDEQIEKLNNVNFSWKAFDDKWNKMFNYLIDYFKQYGNSDVPKVYMIEDINLGTWIRNQRIQFRKGILQLEKINKLNSLNFKWDMVNKDLSKYHIKNILKENNMQGKELAAKLGIGYYIVHEWCTKNPRNISKKYLQDISDIFNIDIDLIEPQKRK